MSFDYAVKLFEQYGRRFVRYGYTVTDADMVDHACVRDVDGAEMLVAIEILYENDKAYAPVENPLSAELLGKYFEYDAEKKEYKRSKKDIPSAVKCDKIREQLYADGFDIDGIHYVRYIREHIAYNHISEIHRLLKNNEPPPRVTVWALSAYYIRSIIRTGECNNPTNTPTRITKTHKSNDYP